MTVTAKICGLSDAAALDAAVDGGASHVGLVFYPKGPRAVTLDQARELAERVPAHVTRVGLVVDADDALLAQVAAIVDMLQLHGHEDPARVAAVSKQYGRPVMKALPVATAGDIEAATAYDADWLLFDARPPDRPDALPGGNAAPFDWDLLKGRAPACPWMLAGGLTVENVAEAVARSGAGHVDTSSGVEDAPGVKSPAKIRAFLDAVARLH